MSQTQSLQHRRTRIIFSKRISPLMRGRSSRSLGIIRSLKSGVGFCEVDRRLQDEACVDDTRRVALLFMSRRYALINTLLRYSRGKIS